jgi:hypothetical protein
VVNGGFETGDFTGWTVNDPSGFTGVGTDSAFAYAGNNYAYLGASPNPGSLSQDLVTAPGGLYTLSFWLAHDVSFAPSNEFSVYWNGVLVPLSSLSDAGSFPYTNYTFSNLLATGALTTLEFRYRDDDDFFRLDNVSANAPDSGATIWLALASLSVVFVAHSLRPKVATGRI